MKECKTTSATSAQKSKVVNEMNARILEKATDKKKGDAKELMQPLLTQLNFNNDAKKTIKDNKDVYRIEDTLKKFIEPDTQDEHEFEQEFQKKLID
jgi:hypothetical protein